MQANDTHAVEMTTRHIRELLTSGKTPALTPELAAIPDVADIHDTIVELRAKLASYARGDFSKEMKGRGALAGMVKSLQANMKHLIWQMERVEDGSLTQRIDYMGDFSRAFNNMVAKLDDALNSLRQKEEELTVITNELKMEVEKRGAALAALKKSEENFRYLAGHDPLTGLLNRRSFFAQAEVELARNAIMDNDTCVALMDVDRFKSFNDTYGHLRGDHALRHIADVGRSALRTNDIMGRYGGEEFIFLFSKANIEQGRQAAERIRKLIEEKPVRVDGLEIFVTASFGVMAVSPTIQVDDVLRRAVDGADRALYAAKSGGRNMVCVLGLDDQSPLAEAT